VAAVIIKIKLLRPYVIANADTAKRQLFLVVNNNILSGRISLAYRRRRCRRLWLPNAPTSDREQEWPVLALTQQAAWRLTRNRNPSRGITSTTTVTTVAMSNRPCRPLRRSYYYYIVVIIIIIWYEVRGICFCIFFFIPWQHWLPDFYADLKTARQARTYRSAVVTIFNNKINHIFVLFFYPMHTHYISMFKYNQKYQSKIANLSKKSL